LIYRYNDGGYIDIHHSESAAAGYGDDFHIHDSYEIFYHIKGALDFYIGTHLYSISPGDIVILRNSEIHKAFIKNNENNIYTKIHFGPNKFRHLSSQDSSLLKAFTDRMVGTGNILRPSRHDSVIIRTLFSEITTIGRYIHENVESIALSYFIRVLCLINSIFNNKSGEVSNRRYNPLLYEIIKHINRNLQYDLRLETLCRIFYISPQHLNRLFRDTIGGTVHNYIICMRLIRAKQLLMENMSVDDCCSLSGFNDYSNFVRTFKSRIGITPGKYTKTTTC
jgi:AraC-like DNA-binding protein